MDRAASGTLPRSYSEVCDTFGAARCFAARTDSGRIRFVNLSKHDGSPTALVIQHVSERTPSCIQDGFRHLGFRKFGGVHVANEYSFAPIHKSAGCNVQVVLSAILNFRVDSACAFLATGALRFGEFLLESSVVLRVLDLLAVGRCGEFLQSEVDTYAAITGSFALRGVDAKVDVPSAKGILSKGPALDRRPIGEFSVLPDRILLPKVGNGRRPELDSAPGLERNPPEGTALAPRGAISRALLVLVTGLGELLCDVLNRIRVQPKLFGGSGAELDQVKSCRPSQPPALSVPLGIDAEIPDKVNRRSLFLEVLWFAYSISKHNIHDARLTHHSDKKRRAGGEAASRLRYPSPA